MAGVAAAAPDAVAAELTDADEAAETLRERHEEIAARCVRSHRARGIRQRRAQGKLDAAEIEREHATGEHTGSVAGPARRNCCGR